MEPAIINMQDFLGTTSHLAKADSAGFLRRLTGALNTILSSEEPPKEIWLDFSSIEYASFNLINLLFELNSFVAKKTKGATKMLIENPQEPIRAILRMPNIDKVIRIVSSDS